MSCSCLLESIHASLLRFRERVIPHFFARFQIGLAILLPHPVSLQDVRQQGLHVLTVDPSFGSHVQAAPLNRLLLLV